MTNPGSTEAHARPQPATARVVAVVSDLFFVARIRETARLVDVPLVFARTVADIDAALADGARLVLLDLTASLDHAAVFTALERATPRPPVLGYTTHALAASTQPWHARCDRVVTKETLTRELATLLREGPR